MSRITIVLASLLKPVNDTRMFEKLGLSLSQTNKYDVNIIGFSVKKFKKYPNVRLYPIFNFKRLSFRRILAPLKFFNLILKVKPDIIVVNSHDLLIVTLLYKIIYGSKIIYDIQENYYRNIVYNRHFPWFLRHITGTWVRMKEWACLRFIDHTFLAEEGYVSEMPYLTRKPCTVLLNKYRQLNEAGDISPVKRVSDPVILYSGTISANYGIFRCIDFIDAFHAKFPDVSLCIIGYCAHTPTYRKLLVSLRNKPYIQLVGGNELVQHTEIIRSIRQARFGLINYDINPSTENCFPTRIYEYLACQLPVLVQNFRPWSDYVLKHDAGIRIDFDRVDYDDLYLRMTTEHFYRDGISEDVFWESEEKKLLNIFYALE